MAVAAMISGDSEEVEFWMHLSQTLSTVYERVNTLHSESVKRDCLWDEASAVNTARARTKLHDMIPRSNIESHPELQEKRLLEYVSLGDYQTAVGFLLSSAPEASVRYYRDSLCAYALSSVSPPERSSSPTASPSGGRTLRLQVAKVVSAHAASMGDSLLGVPLLCAAGRSLSFQSIQNFLGLHHEAVNLLQDASLWSYASVLTASTLEGPHHAVSCLRWAQYVWRYEGSLWRAVGILTTGGCLREAAQLLADAGYVDCAAAYCLACDGYQLTVPQGDGIHALYSALPNSQFARMSAGRSSISHNRSMADEDFSKYSMTSIMNSYKDYITTLLTGL